MAMTASYQVHNNPTAYICFLPSPLCDKVHLQRYSCHGHLDTARYLTSSSSTAKFSVALGGMVGFTPDVPYACVTQKLAHAASGVMRPAGARHASSRCPARQEQQGQIRPRHARAQGSRARRLAWQQAVRGRGAPSAAGWSGGACRRRACPPLRGPSPCDRPQGALRPRSRWSVLTLTIGREGYNEVLRSCSVHIASQQSC